MAANQYRTDTREPGPHNTYRRVYACSDSNQVQETPYLPRGPNAKDALSTLKNPNSPAGKHELATDLQLVTFTKSQQFKFLVLGLKPDKSVFAVGAGQSGVRSAQSHAEETLHPAKLEPKE